VKDNSSLNISNLASFAKLERFLESRRDPSSKESELNFEEFEVRVDRLSHELESEIKALALSRYDVEATSISINGELLRKCLEKEPKRYMTASGPIAVERRLYRSRGGGKSICPLELRAGIVGGVYTPVLARQMTYMMGNMISVETSKLFDERNIEGPSSSSCDRLPKMVSERWEEYRREWEDALREQETVPGEATVLAASLDGVMVADKDGQREAKLKREEAMKKNLSKRPATIPTLRRTSPTMRYTERRVQTWAKRRIYWTVWSKVSGPLRSCLWMGAIRRWRAPTTSLSNAASRWWRRCIGVPWMRR
jgi:hypothetical protein